MFGKMAPKAVSGLVAFALAATMCPAAGLAFAAEGGSSQQATSTDSTTTETGTGSGSADRVSEDVALDTSGSESPSSDGSADAGPSGDGGSQTESSASSGSASKYTSSSADRVSADVSLSGDATVGTIEYNGLAYTINEDEPATVSVTGLATNKPAGDMQVPEQIASGDKLYTVTSIKASGVPEGSNPYAEDLFDDKAKALSVSTISLSATVKGADPAFFQLFPNLTDIYVASGSEAYTSYDGALYSADKAQLILVPQGKGSLVLPNEVAAVPAYVFSQSTKLSAISFSGSTGNDFLAVKNNILYTSDYSTLLAAPAGLGASASIAPEAKTIAEGAFAGNPVLETIVVSGAVSEIAKAGDTAQDANGSALMSGSAVEGSTLPAFSEQTVASATVVINVEAEGDEAAALIERAKAAWIDYGFTSFKEPAKPGTEIKPTEGSGFGFTLLSDYTLSVAWVGDEAAPAAIEVPDYGVIDGVQYTVSTIAPHGFYSQFDIITVELPQTVTTISQGAFQQCINLQTIHFDSVTAIGAQAFANTALLSLVLPATVQTIGDNAFSNMKGTDIVALGSIADNSPIALGAASGLNVYVPMGTEGAWDAGIPTLGNHIYPYGVKLSQEPLELEVGETANIADGGYIEAPGAIETNYSYKASPISINTETGEVEAFTVGASNINVSLSIVLNQVAVDSQKSSIVKLRPIALDGTESESEISKVESTVTLNLGSASKQVRVIEVPADDSIAIEEVDAEDLGKTNPAINRVSGLYSLQSSDGTMLASDTVTYAAGDVAYVGQLKFTEKADGTYSVVRRDDNLEGDVVIPATINGKKVTEMASGGFQKCAKLKSIYIPETISTIAFTNVFDYSMALESITVSGSNPYFKSIDGSLYSKDGLTLYIVPLAVSGHLSIAAGVNTIATNLGFSAPNIVSVNIPATVKSIGTYFLSKTDKLKSVEFPDSVTSFGTQILRDCPELSDITLGAGISAVPAKSFYNCPKLTDIYVKGTITSAIPSDSFTSSTVKGNITVHLPKNASAAEKKIWTNAGFTKFDDIENKLTFTRNADNTFSVAAANTNISGPVVIPNTWDNGDGKGPGAVTTIGSNAFNGCANITTVYLPASIKNVVFKNAFDYCSSLYSFTVEKGNKVYKSVEGSVYSLDGATLYLVPLAHEGLLPISSGVTDIAINVGYSCHNITSVHVPATVKSIGTYFLSKTDKLKSVEFPDSVTSFGTQILRDCPELSDITLGAGISAVPAKSFYNCPKLTDIYVKGTITSAIPSDSFTSSTVKGNITVHLPKNASAAEKKIWTDAGFRKFADLESGLTFTRLSDGNFSVKQTSVDKLSGPVVIPSTWDNGDGKGVGNVTSIPDGAFRSNPNITSVYFPKTTTDIVFKTAFDYSYNIREFTFAKDNPVYKSVEGCVYSKDGRTLCLVPLAHEGHLEIADGIESIALNVGYSANLITSVKIPSSVKTIGRFFMSHSDGIKSIVFPDSITSMESDILRDCSTLTDITLGTGLTSIPTASFYNCPSLSDVYVRGVITKAIDSKSFAGIDKSKVTIHLPEGATDAERKIWIDAGFTLVIIGGRYTLSFNSMGGSAVASQNLTSTAVTVRPATNPTRSGFTFVNWYADSACSTVFAFGKTISKDTVVYAGWNYNSATKITYTVRYWKQKLGGNASIHDSANYEEDTAAKTTGTGDPGQTITVTPAANKYTGFTAPAAWSETLQVENSPVINMYYTRNSYTYTLGTDDKVNTAGSTASGTLQYGASITLKAAIKNANGYAFTKWASSNKSIQADVAEANKTITMPAGNITMTPQHQVFTFTIALSSSLTVASDGVTGLPTSAITRTFDNPTYTLPTLSAVGWTFGGWYTASSFADAKKLSSNDISVVDYVPNGENYASASKTITFYAKWTVNSYTIQYRPGDDTAYAKGTNPANKTGQAYNSTVAATANPYTNYGFDFAGWSLKASLNGANSATGGGNWSATATPTMKEIVKAYMDAKIASNGAAPANGATITLYATWAPRTYTINYATSHTTAGKKYDANNTYLVEVAGVSGASVPAASKASVTLKYYDAVRAATKKDNTVLAAPSDFTGYTFSAWKGGVAPAEYTAGAALTDAQFKALFGNANNQSTAASNTASLEAVWTVLKYDLVFSRNNASASDVSGSGAASGKYTMNQQAYNATIALPKAETYFTREGWHVDNWYFDASHKNLAGKADGTATNIGVSALVTNANTSLSGSTINMYGYWLGDNDINVTVKYYFERPGEAADDGGTFDTAATTENDYYKTATISNLTAGEAVKLADKATTGGVDYLDASTVAPSGNTYELVADAGYKSNNSAQGKVTNSTTGTVAGDGSTVLTVYYKLKLSAGFDAGSQGTGSYATKSDYVWGEKLIVPTVPDDNGIKPANKYAYQFAGWNTNAADAASGSTITMPDTVTNDVTYTAAWSEVVYTLKYDTATMPAGISSDKLTFSDTSDQAFTYADMMNATAASKIAGSAKPAVGYTFKGWNNKTAASDTDLYAPGSALATTDGTDGTFAALFPNAPVTADATLKVNAVKNTYTVNFYKFAATSTDAYKFDVSGISAPAGDITVDSTITMPSQMANAEDTAGSKLTGLNGSANIEDTKMRGYALSKWSLVSPYAEAKSYTLGQSVKVSDLIALAADAGEDITAVGSSEGIINLYAAWNYAYCAALPTDSATAKIMMDVAATSGDSEADVKVRTSVPHKLWVTATSDLVADDDGNNVKLWDAILKSDGTKETLTKGNVPAGFKFTWNGKSFSMDGGSALFELVETTPGTPVEVGGKLTLAIPSSGYIVNPSTEGYTQEGDKMCVDRGQIARIIWTISDKDAGNNDYKNTGTYVYDAQP